MNIDYELQACPITGRKVIITLMTGETIKGRTIRKVKLDGVGHIAWIRIGDKGENNEIIIPGPSILYFSCYTAKPIKELDTALLQRSL